MRGPQSPSKMNFFVQVLFGVVLSTVLSQCSSVAHWVETPRGEPQAQEEEEEGEEGKLEK